ncbi:UvrD-helicase domain-containing protein [Candidatus Gromoviella agglomerans]|uniref:UvrD-helicase domain-containing protein n=1 Tax=Candidatus Gromoviella agglomerans TaxID=2806609 RepID=UPI001E4603AF|nr:UvrD-helicase domain-containing protein [Candidatus Gromoviella agglomerans]UFX98412.1 Double-strand break repair helicase AddA [Candidatus Gromoviella agglomerans]
MKIHLDKNTNVWIEASAGCGKTKALTDRVLSLLISELINNPSFDPTRILCFTFTNMATNEMNERILLRIKYWADVAIDELIGDSLIFEYVKGMTQYEMENFQISIIKRLYELSQKKSWVRVQTFHSFCKDILNKFSAALNIPLGFEVIDDYSDFFLQATNNVLGELTPLSFADILQRDFELADRLSSDITHLILGMIFEMDSFFDSVLEKARNKYTANITNIVNVISEISNMISHFYEYRDEVHQFVMNKFGKLPWFENPCIETFFDYQSLFITTTGEIRKVCQKNDFMLSEASEVLDLTQKIHLLKKNIRDFAINYFALLVKREYILLKNMYGMLDYDDLIDKMFDLVSNNKISVSEFINGSIDHILIDEAQDINPKQWSIIYKLFEDILCSGGEISLCVVGDPKQSIYGFHGANQNLFYEYYQRFKFLLENSKRKFEILHLNKCYRCGDEILKCVDNVFFNTKIERYYKGHITCGKMSKVEIWPLIMKDDKASPQHKLAKKIVITIKDLFSEGFTANDIMILLRNRNEMLNALVAEFDASGILFTSSFSAKLIDTPLVINLLNFARLCCDMSSNFHASEVLKSIGMSTSAILKILQIDKNKSIMANLMTNPLYRDISNIVRDVFDRKDDIFDFFSKAYAIMKMKDLEIFDQFLSILYEYDGVNCMQSILQWLSAKLASINSVKLKNRVRIFSVHAAKGLESEVIFMPDTTVPPLDVDIEEYYRLLYVAMTRAKSRLYVGGWNSPLSTNNAWYFQISKLNPNLLK